MTTTALSHLFRVTIRRSYTPALLELWRTTPSEDTVALRWGDDAESVRAAAAENLARGDRALYSDEVVGIEAVPDAELAALRDAAARHYDLVISRVRSPLVVPSYAPCCDLAILRSCVCVVSYTCPIHGRSCHGSHD